MDKPTVTIFWHRRDLRIDDNAGLYRALSRHKNVLPIFIFDRNILDELENKSDKRVDFIHQYIVKLADEYKQHGSALKVFYTTPEEAFKELLKEYTVEGVCTNKDYEPYATKRDEAIRALLSKQSIELHAFKDQVIFEKDEVLKDDGKPYTVYTPYSRKWLAKLNDFYLKPYPVKKYLHNLLQRKNGFEIPSLKSMGFEKTDLVIPPENPNKELVKNYHNTRDIPGIHGTTHMAVHLRFGTVGIRKLAAFALNTNKTWLNELIWREFFMQILWHFPKVVNHAFKPTYDNIKWRNNEGEFERWCNGQTGYPIVDAGMRELNTTGFMHNRVRMVVASFLVKHLLIDWRWGEAYFAQKLLDYDLSANNGNWQWAAGSGCDAAPYFRVFNPELQTKKFDPDLKYIRKWVPEFEDVFTYPKPIVEHTFARDRVLKEYKRALKSSQ